MSGYIHYTTFIFDMYDITLRAKLHPSKVRWHLS